ncbi:hypothetical protein [Achromobacter xylosoxidans]|nr:hypothetical protein [Achromobacter xylosoxidans]QNP88561.1 hypothetical protein IAG39_14055 [Achromobacter xylosoxidans]
MNDAAASERRWRRRSLWLLPILLALTLYWSARDSVARWLGGRELQPREIAAGAQAPLGGAQWQLRQFAVLEPPAGRGWQPGSRAALAAFSVQVQSADLPTRWRGCRIALHDAQGRTWLPAIAPALRLPRGTARGCVAAAHSGAAPGASVEIMEAFMVPADAAAPWSITVSIDAERPAYLRFAPPDPAG